MARMLSIDDAARAKVAKVVAYAMEHPYYPGGKQIPGDNPNYVAQLDTYRCVFTFTHTDIGLLRHLSISISVEGKYPHPIAAFTIADLFGFTGYDFDATPMRPGEGWAVQMNEKEHCIVLAQETK